MISRLLTHVTNSSLSSLLKLSVNDNFLCSIKLIIGSNSAARKAPIWTTGSFVRFPDGAINSAFAQLLTYIAVFEEYDNPLSLHLS